MQSIPAVMRAALLEDVGRLSVRDVPVGPLAPHEVRVAVQAVGLCGTDAHIFAGHANYHRDLRGRVIPLHEQPQIPGHEVAGIVAEVGSAGDLAVGDRVVVDQGRTCVGEGRAPLCEYCATGDSHQCEFYAEHGITGLPGGLAEYLVVPAVNAIRLEGDLAAEQAALTEPLGCIVHATDVLLRTPGRYSFPLPSAARTGSARSGAVGGTAAARAEAAPIRTVLVTGTGPAGLLFIQYLRNVLGFEGMLLAMEPSPTKRALAVRYGAEIVESAAEVQDRTDGRRVELVIEASGSASAFAAVPAMMRKQGTLLLYGHGHSGMDLSAMSGVQYMEPTLLSPVGASGGYEADRRPTTYLRALRLLEAGTIEVAPMITHRYRSLEEVPGALAGDSRREGYVKGVVMLEGAGGRSQESEVRSQKSEVRSQEGRPGDGCGTNILTPDP